MAGRVAQLSAQPWNAVELSRVLGSAIATTMTRSPRRVFVIAAIGRRRMTGTLVETRPSSRYDPERNDGGGFKA